MSLPGVGEDRAEFALTQKSSVNEKHSEQAELFRDPYFYLVLPSRFSRLNMLSMWAYIPAYRKALFFQTQLFLV